MTISSTSRKAGPYTANGGTTNFAFGFKVFTSADVRVVYTPDDTGIEADLVESSNYTVSLNADQDENPGGSITTIGGDSPYDNGTITLTSQVSELQETELPSGGGWFPKVVENALDRLTIIAQQTLLLIRGGLRQPISDAEAIGELPSATERAEKYLYFDVNGDPTAVETIAGDVVVSSAMEPVVGAASIAAAKVLLEIPAESNPWTTGDVKLTLKTTADTGWVMFDDGTIGSATSGATTRANADTVDLYTLLWNNVSDTYAPVTTGRGANAAADFAANKAIGLTKVLGRALGIAGAGSGLTSRALGLTTGVETHALTEAELPSHTHNAAAHTHSFSATSSGVSADHSHSAGTYSAGVTNPGSGIGNVSAVGDSAAATASPAVTGTSGGASADHTHTVSGTSGSGGAAATSAVGSGTAHQNMPPISFFNAMIKL